MKTLTYTKAHDLAQLADELLAALPALRPTLDPNGAVDPFGNPLRTPILQVADRGDTIRLGVPDDADEAAIGAIVGAHDPAVVTAREAAEAERTAATDDVRTAATAAMTRLDAIIANGGTFTAAQVRDGLIDVARIERRLLRLLRAQAG